MAAGEDDAPEELGAGGRITAQPVAVGFEQLGQRGAVGRSADLAGTGLTGGLVRPTAAMSCQMEATRRWMISAAASRRPSSGSVRSMVPRARSTGSGSKACSRAASISDSLSGKTRKMVPSAMPAASAIWRVVTMAPSAISSGMVAATMAARRFVGGRGAARWRAWAWPSSDAAVTAWSRSRLVGEEGTRPSYLSESSLIPGRSNYFCGSRVAGARPISGRRAPTAGSRGWGASRRRSADPRAARPTGAGLQDEEHLLVGGAAATGRRPRWSRGRRPRRARPAMAGSRLVAGVLGLLGRVAGRSWASSSPERGDAGPQVGDRRRRPRRGSVVSDS